MLTRPDVSQIVAPGARTLDQRLSDFANVTDYGAIGDGIADDTAAFTAALAAHNDVRVPAGTFRATATIVVSAGHRLVGAGKYYTILLIDHVSGAGVSVTGAQAEVTDMQILASDTRQAMVTLGYALIAGLYGLKIYSAAGFNTQCSLRRLLVHRHPSHGIYMGGEGAGTVFDQCESYYNRGHGYAFDDRTIGGGTSSRCGIVKLDNCRALDNGGNGLHLSQTGSTCYRFVVTNFESLWSAWNTDIAGLENAELYVGGENHEINTPALSDSDGDTRVTMANGDDRLAKTSLSVGAFIRGGANNVQFNLPRFVSTSKGIRTGSAVGRLRVNGHYFSQQQVSGADIDQSIGFDIGAGCTDMVIDGPPSDAVTTMIASDTFTDYPMVVNEALAADYAITATGAYETAIAEAAYFPVGLYRITCALTIQNGINASAYLLALLLDNLDGGADLAPAYAARCTIGASEYGTLNLSFLYRVTAAANYTARAQVQQATGALGSVVRATATTGLSVLQVERVR